MFSCMHNLSRMQHQKNSQRYSIKIKRIHVDALNRSQHCFDLGDTKKFTLIFSAIQKTFDIPIFL